MGQLFSTGCTVKRTDAGFNKLLSGTEDQLAGYKLKDLQIEEFGMEDYFVAMPSENPRMQFMVLRLLFLAKI
jgi:hypothetical protein